MKKFSQVNLSSFTTLKTFDPFAPASNRNAWLCVDKDLFEYILENANEALAFIRSSREKGVEPWPALPASYYMRFCDEGNRLVYETPYFKRRNLLVSLSLYECCVHDGSAVDDIIDGIMYICEESGWQLPAHNSYHRNEKQLNLAVNDKPVIDLFAAETGALLALLYYLLKDELDARSTIVCERMVQEVRKRIIDPYLKSHFWWMGNEDEVMCNWTPWCTQNVLLCAFLMPFDENERLYVLKKALYSLDCFVKDYGDDGCCTEGVEYYRHAALCLFNAMEIIDSVADGILDDFYSQKKIRNIAEYIVNMHVHKTEYYFNFGDCAAVAGNAGVREYLAGRAVSSPLLMEYAKNDWDSSTRAQKLLNLSFDAKDGVSLYYVLQSLFCSKEMRETPAVIRDDTCDASRSVWYPSNGIFAVHSRSLAFAVSAGNNGDSHNHNDTGSFILYKNGKPFVIDVGVETYSAKTFSSRRYEIWTMQSSYHNLCDVNGVMQKDGSEYCARNVSVDGLSIRMDLSSAYPASEFPEGFALNSFVRSVSLEQDGEKECLVVSDSCDSSAAKVPLVLSLMVSCEPKIVDGGDGVCIEVGDVGVIQFLGIPGSVKAEDISIETIAVEDARLRRSWPERIYRIRIKGFDDIKIKLV